MYWLRIFITAAASGAVILVGILAAAQLDQAWEGEDEEGDTENQQPGGRDAD